MKNVDQNLVVVFEDAADCECALLREKRLPSSVNPYVILKDDSLGVPRGAELAPEVVQRTVLGKSAEPFTTWMRINGSEWVSVNPAQKEDELFDSVFKSSFQKRLQQLHYVLEALGCKRTKLVSTERRSVSTEDRLDQKARGKVKHPVVNVSADEKFRMEQSEKYQTIIQQTLCQEFLQHDAFDPQKAEQLLANYGFSNDPILRGILDAERLGRKGPAQRLTYSFSGEFVGDIASKVSAALKVAAGLKKVPVSGELDTSLDRCRKRHEEIIQTLSIEIEND